MINFSLRLDNNLFIQLSDVADYLGVVKSSIIIFAIFHNINTNFEILQPNTNNSTRTTLRIPENINNQLDIICNQNNLSKNTLVNSYLKKYLDTYFSNIEI